MIKKTKNSSIYSLAILLCFLLAAEALPLEFPDNPAGLRAKEIVSLLNGEFPRSAEEYIQNDYAPGFRDAFPITSHKQIFDSTKVMFGKLELAEVTLSTPTQISFTLCSQTKEAWLNISINVEEAPPNRITSMGIRPGSRPASLDKNDKMNPEAEREKTDNYSIKSEHKPVNVTQEELHKLISAKAKDNKFSGVVLVARDGRPLFHRAYGHASKRFKVQNQLDTKFNLGSINKSFTTVAIMQLVEQEKLSLDEPIGKYLDDFPPEIADKVTIKHLLNMRSGWGDFWGNENYLARFSRLRKVSDYMEFIIDIPLNFEPGTNFQHSNTGFDVAGAIIEKVTGEDYFDFVKKHIFEPAGMNNTDSFHKDGPVENMAVGYTNMNRNDPDGTGYCWENTYMMPPRGTPAGGGYSTSEDLLKYDQALRNNLLLSESYTDYMFNRFEGKVGDPYIPKGVYRAVGGAPGINAFFAIDFKTGFTFIVLSNYDHPAAVILAEEIIKMYGLM